MKRSVLIVLSCVCALAIALFGLSACGSSGSSGSTAKSSSAAASNGEQGAETDEGSGSGYSSEEVTSMFEQIVMGMSEFYKGSTPVGEQLYYAGGADGDNAVLVLVVPETNASAVFLGPATVGEDNRLTITDSTTNSTLTFDVTDNEDGTYSFSMGTEYGAAIMEKCSSGEIVDALTEVVLATEGNQTDGAEQPQE